MITLEKADSAEFARWWVVYRNTNEDFSQSLAEQNAHIEGIPVCYWILRDGQRVGGTVQVGQRLGDVFFVPTYHDTYVALKSIVRDFDITSAEGIVAAHVPHLQKLGFTIKEARHWMLRPTQKFDIALDDFRREPADPSQADDLAALMLAAFSGGVGAFGTRKLDDHAMSIADYFQKTSKDALWREASSVLFDGEKMIAACLLQPYKSLPTLRFVMTHPDYQGRGLGRRLMQFGIDAIHHQHDFVTLAVTVGNPAAGLYGEMGFVAGPAIYHLAR